MYLAAALNKAFGPGKKGYCIFQVSQIPLRLQY